MTRSASSTPPRVATVASALVLLGLVPACGPQPLGPNELPTAVLLAPEVANADETIELDASGSTDPDGRLVEYWLVFADGTPRVTTAFPIILHTFDTPGTYGVALVVFDDRGGSNRVDIEIVIVGDILPPPPECTVDGDCETDETCEGGACVPTPVGCDGPEDCQPGEICEAGECIPSKMVDLCVREADCGPGEACQLVVVGVGLFATECRPELAGGAELGEPCSIPSTAIGCPPGPSGPTFCRTGICISGVCSEICDGAADCPSDNQCTDLRKMALGDVGPFTGCLPDPFVGTDAETVAALALGFGAPSPPFTVTAPSDAVSMTLVTSDIGADRVVSLVDLSAPDGTVLWDLVGFTAGFPQPLVQLPFWELSVATLPSTPALEMCAGAYTVRFTAEEAVDGVALNRIFKTASGTLGGGTLDLNLWFVGTMASPNASTAPTDGAFQSELAYAEEMLLQAGISLGTINYLDLTGPQADALQIVNSVVGPGSELAELLALSSMATNPALNVYFVSMIDDPAAPGTIGGVAGGAPGPPGFLGSKHSGVVVSLLLFPSFFGVLGQTLAHEAGHYLGLQHTTEPDGSTFESIPDTAICDTSFDTNGDGTLIASECAAAGAENLMFWTASMPLNVEMTPGQGFVIVRHPNVEGL